MNVREILDERAHTHGPYPTYCEILNELDKVILASDSNRKVPLCPISIATLSMIATKISRILNATDPLFRDNWADIAGYAQLVLDYIDTQKNK